MKEKIIKRCRSYFSFFSGGSLKISLTFLKVRFFMTRGLGPRPFIFRLFMWVSFIVTIFVLVFSSGMFYLFMYLKFFRVRFFMTRGFRPGLFTLRLFILVFVILMTFVRSFSSGIFYPSPARKNISYSSLSKNLLLF